MHLLITFQLNWWIKKAFRFLFYLSSFYLSSFFFFFFAEQYESFVKFTQDQIMRRYGARPASCKHLISHVSELAVWPYLKRSPCVSDVSWIGIGEIPASSHNMAALQCIFFFSFLIPPSQTVWVPWFFFMQKLISNYTNIAAGQTLGKSESIFSQQCPPFPLLLLIYSFWNLWFKQICIKSYSGAVEKERFLAHI